MYLSTLIILTFGATAIAKPDFTTHVARQATNSEGGRIEQTAASLNLPTESTPEPSAGPLSDVEGVDGNITSWAWLWGWHDCSNGQKNAILNGLSEAHTVLSTDGVYNIDKHWNDYATVEYLGNPKTLHLDKKKKDIRDKFNRAYKYQQSWFSWYDTQVYCGSDEQDKCAKKEPGYIWVDNGGKKDYLELTFCPRYFKLGTLRDIYDTTIQGEKSTDLGEYENRARAWITAMMRISWIRGKDAVTYQFVKYPERNSPARFAESSSEAKLLAKSNGGTPRTGRKSQPLLSAPNYAWYALAQWVQQTNGSYPQQPYVPDDTKPRPQI